ncbi:hypothetical protein R3P38DRAFT_2810635 [Favolaschia claudopus]|uniref:Uncharacterized protein n=1 Tax=Favolaschia claudopus TaxID=2862362 RepID=A0AAV9ZAP1_9AGAR
MGLAVVFGLTGSRIGRGLGISVRTKATGRARRGDGYRKEDGKTIWGEGRRSCLVVAAGWMRLLLRLRLRRCVYSVPFAGGTAGTRWQRHPDVHVSRGRGWGVRTNPEADANANTKRDEAIVLTLIQYGARSIVGELERAYRLRRLRPAFLSFIIFGHRRRHGGVRGGNGAERKWDWDWVIVDERVSDRAVRFGRSRVGVIVGASGREPKPGFHIVGRKLRHAPPLIPVIDRSTAAIRLPPLPPRRSSCVFSPVRRSRRSLNPIVPPLPSPSVGIRLRWIALASNDPLRAPRCPEALYWVLRQWGVMSNAVNALSVPVAAWGREGSRRRASTSIIERWCGRALRALDAVGRSETTNLFSGSLAGCEK